MSRVRSCCAAGSSTFTCTRNAPSGRRSSSASSALTHAASIAHATRSNAVSARIKGPSPAGTTESDPGCLMYEALCCTPCRISKRDGCFAHIVRMCLSDAVPGPSPCGPQYGSIAMPLAIASREAACDDKRARNASNDAVTLTPTLTLLRWKNHGDASSSWAVGSPPLTFDVAYQRKAHYVRWSNRAHKVFVWSCAKTVPHFHVKLLHVEQRN